MSPRASSSAPRSTTSTPYTRRAAGQPKSTRQQFSACGACRMRRVRCDLKDLPATTSTTGVPQPSCSNCKERGIKCVDEFAEVKAVKLLRRGRRLQQVEAVYGKVTDDASAGLSSSPAPQNSTPSNALSAAITGTKQSLIPQLRLDFLNSSFFRRFCIQRPVIEPTEFTARFIAHSKGTTPLNVEGQMLAMLLVTWAASFGVNEYGVEEGPEVTSPHSPTSPNFAPDSDDEFSDPRRRMRALRTEAMTREILALVDVHGILRRPSWDGVRVLLLLMPLTQGIQNSIERLTTYEATLSQIYSLCSIANPSSVNSGQGPYCDALVRARVFWYAHVHEGVTTGLRGGRLLLDDDDLVAFQSTLPPQYCASATHSTTAPGSASSHSSPSSPVSSDTPLNALQDPRGHSRASLAYLLTTQYFSLALAVSGVCRAIHSVLTGPRARRRAEAGIPIREDALMEIWDSLERCWDDFEALRHGAGGIGTVGGGIIRGEDVERFVSGWQVLIFECLNVIREALKQRMVSQSQPQPSPSTSGRTTPSDQAFTVNLHAYALRRCRIVLPRVIDILKRHLAVTSSGFFAHDAGLVRDGCFFAGLLLAQSDLDGNLESDLEGGDGVRWDSDVEEGVEVCLRALGEIRWVYANAHEREKTLRAIWEARIDRDNGHHQDRSRTYREGQISQVSYHPDHNPQNRSPYMDEKAPAPRNMVQHSVPSNPHPRSLSLISAGGQARPHLPPISVSFPRVDSGPDTAVTDDGSGSWPTYTPPTTSGSMTSTVATQRSVSPVSPPNHPSMKHIQHTLKSEDAFYGGVPDMDPFSFSVESAASAQNLAGPGLGSQWTSYSHQHQSGANGYLDPSVIFTSDAALGRVSDDGCPHFGSDCQAYYH
ncbi:hypothetical protein HYDPIDRAFT_98320 [Hydnomerulius pinastri MD-312]|uniref:Zn(2)-C6 fungal-type domain-containing protein n=1 Tax=Hydnomerulius pinastri MD-312 TaxID=994086 RepID=A0A0C9WBC4_9AGAM|nr:hypothetical protein HYDPIDRAFT_98320 [Hydnomerulius pinastri MD-312]